MRRRVVVSVAFVAILAAVGAAMHPRTPCHPASSPTAARPSTARTTTSIVQSHGDSIGVGYTNMMRLPDQYSLFNAAQGASTFTLSYSVPLISERVHQWVEQCGNPGVVVIEGGIIDLTLGVPLEAIQAAVTELSDWLEARGIPTVWMGIHPFPQGQPRTWRTTRSAQAYNEWLTTPGNVLGHRGRLHARCSQDPANPGTMNPAYWKIVDLFGSPDGLHPNTAGYIAMAECVKPLILDALAAG